MEMTPSDQGKPGRPDVAVIITRQVLAAMRAESFLRAEETGGHLHGVLSEDSSTLLVVFACGPGRRARHASARFEPDTAHQQELLDAHRARFGVSYCGEWHKHPGRYSRPSPHDLAQLAELLREYRLPFLLAVITLCDRERGFKALPYLAWLEGGQLEVAPVDWRIVPLALAESATGDVRSGPVGRQVATADPNRAPAPADGEAPAPPSRSPVRRLWTSFLDSWKRRSAFCSLSGLVEPMSTGSDNPKRGRTQKEDRTDVGKRPEAMPEADVRGDRVERWYLTSGGRRRLLEEKRRLDAFGLRYRAFVTSSGEIGFSFEQWGGEELLIVCPGGFPAVRPQLIVSHPGSGGAAAIRQLCGTFTWSPSMHLSDLVVPLQGEPFSPCGRETSNQLSL